VAVAATSRGGWFVAARAAHGNPYDGHTLAATLAQIERAAACLPAQVFVDRGFFVGTITAGRSTCMWTGSGATQSPGACGAG
jgi:IS5 family transposase